MHASLRVCLGRVVGQAMVVLGFGRPVWLPCVAYAQPMMRPASKHERALPAMLAAPGVQLGFGLAALLATAGAVRHDRVGPREVRAFRAASSGRPGLASRHVPTMTAILS